MMYSTSRRANSVCSGRGFSVPTSSRKKSYKSRLFSNSKVRETVRNSLNRIRKAVCVVVHWINRPCIACLVMHGIADPVKKRITHLHVRGAHVPFCSNNVLSIFELTGTHSLQEIEVLFNTAVSVGTRLTCFAHRPAVFADLLPVRLQT